MLAASPRRHRRLPRHREPVVTRPTSSANSTATEPCDEDACPRRTTSAPETVPASPTTRPPGSPARLASHRQSGKLAPERQTAFAALLSLLVCRFSIGVSMPPGLNPRRSSALVKRTLRSPVDSGRLHINTRDATTVFVTAGLLPSTSRAYHSGFPFRHSCQPGRTRGLPFPKSVRELGSTHRRPTSTSLASLGPRSQTTGEAGSPPAGTG